MYGKCSKISFFFYIFLFLNRTLDIRAGTHKMHVRIANREDPDQTASSDQSEPFVCFVALRPKSTAMVIVTRSVHLTTLFPGQA